MWSKEPSGSRDEMLLPKDVCKALLCSVTASGKMPGKTGSTWHPQGEEGITHGAETMPTSDKSSKKNTYLSSTAACSPPLSCPILAHRIRLPPLEPAPGVQQNCSRVRPVRCQRCQPRTQGRPGWQAEAAQTRSCLTAGSQAQKHNRALQDEDGVQLALNPKGPFPTRQ